MTRTVSLLLMVSLVSLPGVQTLGREIQQMQSAAATTARQRLVALAFPELPAGEPVKCGLAVIAHALRNRTTLPNDLENALVRILQRDVLQKSITAGHFTVHYDTTGPNAAAMLDSAYQDMPGTADQYADSVLAIANRVYAVEIGELGYTAPPSDGTEGGGPQHDIYVEDFSNEYGETIPETALDARADGARWITYMRIDNDFSFVRPVEHRGMPALRVTLAHEFHHMIQLGSYGYWSTDLFFYELTSTWMEDVVFPGVDDYLNYLRASWGHFKNPDVSFSSNDNIMYSRSIWGHFIAAKYGPDVMRAAWQYISNARPLQAMDLALQDQHTTFRIEFIDWALWNYYTGARSDSTKYYPKGSIYPEIVQVPSQFAPPAGLLVGDLQPLSVRYHEVYTPTDSVILIQTNINRATAEQQPGTSFPYTIYLNSSQGDDSYEPAGSSLYFKTSTADPSNWKTMKIVHGIPSYAGIVEGVPFPNPFRPDGKGVVFIPAPANRGTLYVYSSSMDLVFSAEENAATNSLSKQLFFWDGTTLHNELARSGVYIFVLSIPGKTITGKIALIRK